MSLPWDGTTCVAPIAGRLCGHTKRFWEEGWGTRGAQRQETEQREKWSWRVCQGSATYCTTTPPPSKHPHNCLLLPLVSQDTSIPPPCPPCAPLSHVFCVGWINRVRCGAVNLPLLIQKLPNCVYTVISRV